MFRYFMLGVCLTMEGIYFVKVYFFMLTIIVLDLGS